MFCSYCGTAIPDQAAKCSNAACGRPNEFRNTCPPAVPGGAVDLPPLESGKRFLETGKKQTAPVSDEHVYDKKTVVRPGSGTEYLEEQIGTETKKAAVSSKEDSQGFLEHSHASDAGPTLDLSATPSKGASPQSQGGKPDQEPSVSFFLEEGPAGKTTSATPAGTEEPEQSIGFLEPARPAETKEKPSRPAIARDLKPGAAPGAATKAGSEPGGESGKRKPTVNGAHQEAASKPTRDFGGRKPGEKKGPGEAPKDDEPQESLFL